ncbi:S8 family peptidase [Microbacterium sp. NPDC028030]|uniref:S8 family peptidase n=1 Tax=Microbacterium sp. NPDC028030 TaxID=3155124 RepID=UPI0033EAB887
MVDAFDSRRAQLTIDPSEEVDPELVLVFDLAGTIEDFRNAIDKVEGLEFLAEVLGEDDDPDDDFYLFSQSEGRLEDQVKRSLSLAFSNSEAAGQLVRLFDAWRADPDMEFARGLARFRSAFEQLRSIRPWGPSDRVRETGLLNQWRERLDVAGQFISTVRVEVELWYRKEAAARLKAEEHVVDIVTSSGGEVVRVAQIAGIAYHALLVEMPVQQVVSVLERGASAIDLLTADAVMFVSPSAPMTVAPATIEPVSAERLPEAGESTGLPRIALFDGLPFANHQTLSGRLVIDDPDEFSRDYSVASRHHGTAMASLILHGDLSARSDPLQRKLYVRPLLRPHEFIAGHEQVPDSELLPDLLHRAILRMVEGDGGRAPTAPSVRIVNLSIGVESRALVRRMSPLGRLLDWLAVDYNLLFIVSAGNHSSPIRIPAAAAEDEETAREEAHRVARALTRLRGLLPPGDALNALTVGAIHSDESGELAIPDGVWDLTLPGMPAHYGAVGPGVGRSIKPDIYHSGGRVLYSRPVASDAEGLVELVARHSPASPPGTQVAAPSRQGGNNSVAYTYGTSNATALVSREASAVFDVLEAGADPGDPEFPDALYHPVLAKALLVHASSWGERAIHLKRVLGMDPQRARRELTAILGYGAIDRSRLGAGATNRAVLVAGGSIERDQRHSYSIPLPSSLRARPEWHRITLTLAYMAPTVGQLSRYRGTKVFFDTPDERLTAGKRIEAEHHAVRRGSCQHEIIEGERAMAFVAGGALPINVDCMRDGQTLRRGNSVRYGIVVSIETRVETSTTIHDEIRATLRQRVASQLRERV